MRRPSEQLPLYQWLYLHRQMGHNVLHALHRIAQGHARLGYRCVTCDDNWVVLDT